MDELNLLLRHQIIKRSEDLQVNYSMETPQETYYEEEYTSSFVLPSKGTFHVPEDKCEELKIELARVELEESSALEQQKTLIETYNILDTLIEYLLTLIDCTLLEIKASSRVVSTLNSYSIKNQHIDGKTSSTFKRLMENYDTTTLDSFKEKLLTMLNDNSAIKNAYAEFEERQSNYKLALKNFKIILEILNVNEESLGKLKRQFDDVLMDYQHCRCIVDHELPFAIVQRTEVLADCLISLGMEYDTFADRRKSLGVLFKDIGRKVRENEYILVKKQVIGESGDQR